MASVIGNANIYADIISSKYNVIFEWEIDNFRNKLKQEEFLESPKLTTINCLDGEMQWHMRWRVSSNLLYIHTSAKNLVKYDGECFFAIRNNAGNILATAKKLSQSGEYPESLGYVQFELENCTNLFVPKKCGCDKIKIMGGLIIALTYEEKKVNLCDQIMHNLLPRKAKDQVEKQQDDDSSRLAVIAKYDALFNNIKFSDVSLISEGKAVKAHRCILANSSSVFAAMFDAEMKEKRENAVEIADIKYDVLVEMVRYIYTGKVDNMDTLAGELVAAADKYALDELKNSCEKSVARNLSVDNAIECLQIADRYRIDKLKEKAIKFIVENSSHITSKPEFKSLGSDILCEVCVAMSKKIDQ